MRAWSNSTAWLKTMMVTKAKIYRHNYAPGFGYSWVVVIGNQVYHWDTYEEACWFTIGYIRKAKAHDHVSKMR